MFPSVLSHGMNFVNSEIVFTIKKNNYKLMGLKYEEEVIRLNINRQRESERMRYKKMETKRGNNETLQMHLHCHM